MHTTPLDNGRLDEPMEVVRRGLWNTSQTDASNAGAGFLSRDHDQRLARHTSPFPSRRLSTHQGFVYFDPTAEFIPARSHHGPAQFM